MKRALAFAPASIGNVAAGFDVLGAAIEPAGPEPGGLLGDPLGDIVEIALAGADRFDAIGPYADRLPERPEDNLALKALGVFAQAWGRPLPPLAIRLEKNLPVGSGLGSSSATVVATLVALDHLLGAGLGGPGLLRAAAEAESHGCGAAHLDNVAPSLLGGLRLVDPLGRALALPFPEHLRFVLASPALELSTRAARQALPAQVPLELAVAHAQNLAGLVHALHSADPVLLRTCLRDLLAEPHRAPLVPGFRAVQAAALEQGAEGCTLSGAGPALFALADLGRAPAVAQAMARAWEGAGIPCKARICRLAGQGARILEAC